jgi:hypothetical protein
MRIQRRISRPDGNVLVYAHRQNTPDHDRYRHWLEGILNGRSPGNRVNPQSLLAFGVLLSRV